MKSTQLLETIYVTKEDLRQYYFTLSNKCKIRVTLSKIYNSMPRKLRKEFSKIMNELVEFNNGEYRIIAPRASQELKSFLSRFKFILSE